MRLWSCWHSGNAIGCCCAYGGLEKYSIAYLWLLWADVACIGGCCPGKAVGRRIGECSSTAALLGCLWHRTRHLTIGRRYSTGRNSSSASRCSHFSRTPAEAALSPSL